MTAAWSAQVAASLAAWATVGWMVRILIDPRSSLVAPVRRAITWLDSRTAIRIVQVMAAVALVLSVGVGFKQYQLTGCIARYNEANNISQRARSEAADLDRQAQDQLFRAISDDPQHAFDRLRQYNDTRAEADAQRARNPIPAPPSETCG